MAKARDLNKLDESTRLAEEQWAREQKWPLWNVVISGDEVEYVGRPGVNDGKPWKDTARASVRLKAKNEDHAKAIALQANPGYHTVESVDKLDG